jgi:putative transposase
VKFAWIQTEKASYPVTKLCRWLGVTPIGFYAWRQRPESTHTREDRRLKVLVQASFAVSKQRYGSPRIHEDLIEQQEHVSRKRVIRLMQEDGLEARARKRFKSTTMSDHDQPVAANLLDRQFEAAARISAGSATRPSLSSARAASSISPSSSISSRGSWSAGP